jgi:hypothetical protein
MELMIGGIKLPGDATIAMTVQVQVSLQYERTTILLMISCGI